MNDDIVWLVDAPPPKNWKVRHKAGSAVDDKEAHKRHIADTIKRDALFDDFVRDMYLDPDPEDVPTLDDDPIGIKSKAYNLTKDYTGNNPFNQDVPEYGGG